MNTAKIVFNNKSIEVKGCYPYLINPQQGKVVLRITASEEDTTFNDLHSLKENESGIIEYYERTVDESGEEPIVSEWELKNTYDDYNSGEVAIAYQNGQYQADVTRVDGMVKTQAQLRADVDFIALIEDIEL